MKLGKIIKHHLKTNLSVILSEAKDLVFVASLLRNDKSEIGSQSESETLRFAQDDITRSFWTKSRPSRLLLVLPVLFLLYSTAFTDEGPGTTSSDFLRIPVSARSTALGGAFLGVSNDVAALEHNAAGLVGIDRADINVSLINYVEDINMQAFAIGFPISLGEDRSKSASRSSKNLSVGIQYRLFRIEDDARNEVGFKLDSFRVSDQLIHAGVGLPVGERLNLGAAGKFISREIKDKSTNNYAFDAGAQYRFSDLFTGAASVQNLGPAKAFVEEEEPLPALLKLGGALNFRPLLALADVGVGRDKVTRESLGLEWKLASFLKLRGGALYHNTFEFSGGLGVTLSTGDKKKSADSASRYSDPRTLGDLGPDKKASSASTDLDFGLDYGFRTYNEFGLTHTVTLRILY